MNSHLTDSQSALKALSSDQVKSNLVWDCLNALRTLSSRNKLELRWVPGHRGIQGNEKADQLAKKGADTPFFGPEPVVGISTTTAKTSVKIWIRDKHQSRWETYPGQRLARKLVLGPSNSLSLSLLKLDRRGIKSVVALITEHGHFRKHLRRVGLYKDEPICQEEETASHILFDCPLLERKRSALSITRENLGMDSSIVARVLQLVEGIDFGRQC